MVISLMNLASNLTTILRSTLSARTAMMRLAVPPVALGVETLPGLSPAGGGFVVTMALVETSALLASGGEAAEFTVLVYWVDDPVDAGVAADGLVLGVDEDDFKVLVGRILVDPVGV